MEEHSRQVMLEIARETGHDLPPSKRRAAGDAKTLRGIPVSSVKGGLGGTAAGTQPEAALLRKERDRRSFDD